MTGRSHTHGLRREAIGWQSRTAAASRLHALSCIVVIALMVPARTHLRAVTIAPRRHIRSILWRPLVAVAYWPWHVVLLGNRTRIACAHELFREGR
jgi:hypothetical protein